MWRLAIGLTYPVLAYPNFLYSKLTSSITSHTKSKASNGVTNVDHKIIIPSALHPFTPPIPSPRREKLSQRVEDSIKEGQNHKTK